MAARTLPPHVFSAYMAGLCRERRKEFMRMARANEDVAKFAVHWARYWNRDLIRHLRKARAGV